MRKNESCACSRRVFFGAGTAFVLAAALGPGHSFAEAEASGKLKIGVIGSGHIGGTIGGLWVKAGHPALFSSRHPEELEGLVGHLGPLARAGSVKEAIAFGGVIFIAVPYRALPQIGRDYGAALKGKIVLDACNAVARRDGEALAREALENGIGLTSQKYLPGTRLVRAFNSLPARVFASESNRPGKKLAVPIAGDDPEALRVAAGLVRDAGFDPVMVGTLKDASRFQMGAPGYGQMVTADELRAKLALER